MTRIEWAHQACNVVSGCSPASPGCDICYAASLSDGRLKHQSCALPDGARGRRADLVRLGKRRDDPSKHRRIYNGKVALDVPRLRKAMRIPRNGGKKGPRIFWNHLSDTFHEGLSFTEIAAQFAVMAARPDLKFMVLTKRPERAREFFAWVADSEQMESASTGSILLQCYRASAGAGIHSDMTRGALLDTSALRGYAETWPLTNVGLGVSAEDQPRWDARVAVLRELPAAVKFVSVEPMIGPVIATADQLEAIDQVIIGAESGPGARPMDLRWAQDLAREVLDARPALFFKQGAICPRCAGRPDGKSRSCYTTTDTPTIRVLCQGGVTGKVRKDCPEMYVPGHGTQSWAQFPAGWE